MARKKTLATQFGELMAELIKLFDKADMAKLEAAIKPEDYAKLSEALGIPERELKNFLRKGAKLAQGMVSDSLKEAATAFKKSTKV